MQTSSATVAQDGAHEPPTPACVSITIHKVQLSVYLFSMIVSHSKSSPGRAWAAMGLHVVDFSCFCPILKTSLIHKFDLGFQLGSQRKKIIGLLLIIGFSASLAEKKKKKNVSSVLTGRVWGSKPLFRAPTRPRSPHIK